MSRGGVKKVEEKFAEAFKDFAYGRSYCAGRFFVAASWRQDFLLSTPTYDHTARLRRALIGLLVFVTLLATRQEVSKKRAQAFPLGTPAALPQGIRRGVAASGCLYGQALGKSVCCPVLFEICANIACVADSKIFCNCRVRATSVLAFYYQNANAKAEFA